MVSPLSTHAAGVVSALLLVLAAGSAQGQASSTTWGERESFDIDATALARTIAAEDAHAGNADTAELLRSEPAVRIRQRGGLDGPAYVSVRGAEPESTRVLLEGIPLHGATRLALDVNMLLPELLGKLEIYRTTTPLALGQSYPGGVVNLRLRKDSETPLAITLGMGSWWARKASIAYHETLDDGHVWVSAAYRGSQGNFRFYDTNGTDFQRGDDQANARRQNNDFNQGALLIAREWQTEQQRLRLFLVTNGRESGVSGIDVVQAQEARSAHTEQLIAVEGSRPRLFGPTGDARWTLSLLAQQQAFRDPDAEIGFRREDREDQIVMPSGSVAASFWLPHRVSLHVTAEARAEYYSPRPRYSPALVRNALRTDILGGTELRWRTKNKLLALSAAIRGQWQWQRNDSAELPLAPEREIFDAFASPQAGIVVRPLRNDEHALSVFGYTSRTHRQPGFFELYGDGGASVGNPNLVSESQTAIELGASHRFERGTTRFDVQSSYWRHWKQDAIVFLALPQGVRKPFNVDGARAQGVDAFAGFSNAWVDASLAFSWLDTVNRSRDPAVRGNPLPWRSRYSAESSLALRYGDVSIGWNVHFDSSFYTDERALRPAAARIEHDLRAQWASPYEAAPSVRLDVRNIGNRRVDDVPFRDGGRDVTVVRPVSDYSGYPRPGRSVYVTLSWNLMRER